MKKVMFLICMSFVLLGAEDLSFNPIKDMQRFLNDSPYKERLASLESSKEIRDILEEIINTSTLDILEYLPFETLYSTIG